MNEKEIKKLIRKKLNEADIPVNIQGYKYLIEAIWYLVKHDNDNPNQQVSMGEIYWYVATKKKVTTSSVERTIRTAVKHATKKIKKDLKNSEFIHYMNFEIQDELS